MTTPPPTDIDDATNTCGHDAGGVRVGVFVVHTVEMRHVDGGEWSVDECYVHQGNDLATTVSEVTNKVRAHLTSFGYEFTGGTARTLESGWLRSTVTSHANHDYEFRHTIREGRPPGAWLKINDPQVTPTKGATS